MARQTQKTQAIPEDSPQATAEAAAAEPGEATVVAARPRIVAETAETPQSPKSAPKAAEAKAEAKAGGQDAWDPMANTEALNAMVTANQVLLDGMAELQREMMEFGNARLRLDLENQEALTQCTNLQEAAQVQSDFAQQAMQHYAEEASRWFNLSAKLSRDCWGPFEEATRVAFRTVTPR